jgi:hydrogenase maturation protease
MIVNNDGAGYQPSSTIKVIGIGQSLRGDDGAGLAAVRLWNEIYPHQRDRQNIHVELAELPGVSLLGLLEGATLAILVDAVSSGALPGTVHQLAEDQLDTFGDSSASAHGWGVAETLLLGRNLFPSQMPRKLILIGIEAGQLSLGEQLSPAVEASIPEVARLIEQCISAALIKP